MERLHLPGVERPEELAGHLDEVGKTSMPRALADLASAELLRLHCYGAPPFDGDVDAGVARIRPPRR